MRAAVAVVLAIALASCGVRGKRLDTTALVAELGLDGAAEALRIRIAGEPGDVGARRALAALEDRRGRPGAVIEQLEIVGAIGGPFGSRLDDAERARLAALYRERASARALRRSPDGVADLDRARALVGAADEEASVRAIATWSLALAELKDTDPERRTAGAARMATLVDSGDARTAAVARALADPDAASADDLGVAGRWLWLQGARRVAHDLLDRWARAGGEADRDTLEAWMFARSWWGGAADRPDLATMIRAAALGASPCHFAEALGDQGCDGDARGGITRARARGWRTADPAQVTIWVGAAARVALRSDVGWLDLIDQLVDLSALGLTGDARLPPEIPAWARAPLLRAAGRLDDARLALERARADTSGLSEDARRVVAMELAFAGGSRDDVAALDAEVGARLDERVPGDLPAVDEVLAAAVAGVDPTDGLAELARAYLHDPASADRVAADVVARDVDLARTGAHVAALFAVLGDPARARAWWERAADASPLDPTLRAGLVRGLADAGDGAAARVAVVTAAARSGDAGRAMLDGARAMAAAGLIVDALVPIKQALELTAPGEQQDVLALAIELERAMGRDAQVASLGAALAAQRAPRDATTRWARARAGDTDALAEAVALDPADPVLAIAAAAGEADDAAVARLAFAARWNPHDVAVRAALVARAPRDGEIYAVAMSELAGLAVTGGPDEREAAARTVLTASRADASSR